MQQPSKHVRRLAWSAAALALCALTPVLHAAPADADPFAGSLARYQSAAAQLADPANQPDAAALASLASEAIVAAYVSSQFLPAAQLFARYREAGLTPLAVTAGLGAIVQTGSSDPERKAEARRELALIGQSKASEAPLAAPLALAALASDAMLRDDLPAALVLVDAAEERARTDLAPDDPAQVFFATFRARHVQYRDAAAGRLAAENAEKLALAILPEGHVNWIGVWSEMAMQAMVASRFDEAHKLFGRITDLAVREWGDDDPRLHGIFQQHAVALSGLARRQDALAMARAAMALEADKSQGEKAMLREMIGTLLLGEGEVAAATASYREGLALLAGMDPDDLHWGFIQARLARSLSLLGENAEALALAEQAAAAHAAKMPPMHPGRVVSEGMIALAQARSGAPQRAYALLEQTVAANEGRLLDIYVRGQDVRAIAAGSRTLFRDFTWVALRGGRIEEAWRSAQLATLGELAVSTARLSYPGDSEGFGAMLDAVRDARRREAAVREQVAGGEAGSEALGAAIAEREASERALDERYPGHAEFLRPQPMTLAAAQAGLAPHEAIIVPMAMEDRNLTILVTREGALWAETVSPYNSTAALITRLRASLEEESLGDSGTSGFDAAAAHELHRRFFPPEITRALTGKSKLIFPSGGLLAQIPPAVLMSQPATRSKRGRFLIEDYAIAIRSALRPLPPAERASARGFAGIGAPSLSPETGARVSLRGIAINPADLRALPSLPGSQAELEALRTAFAGEAALLLTGEQATEAKVRAAPLGQYRVLAFSTHGLVGGQMAALPEPALVLTPPLAPSPEDDGLLTASEIAALELAADWVILSACNTAAGDGRGSATYSGLARAFQLAGAKALLLSHWPVRDDAAARLSVATVAAAEAGTERSEALRRAQLALLRARDLPGAASPAVWAPFVLIE